MRDVAATHPHLAQTLAILHLRFHVAMDAMSMLCCIPGVICANASKCMLSDLPALFSYCRPPPLSTSSSSGNHGRGHHDYPPQRPVVQPVRISQRLLVPCLRQHVLFERQRPGGVRAKPVGLDSAARERQ